MRTVLVAGAAGGIGEWVVRALLATGDVRVIGTSRSQERLDALRAGLEPAVRESLTTLAGNAGDFAGAGQIAQHVEALGGADAAVAILGRGWWSSGPILAVTPHEWQSIIDEMLTGHVAFARAVIPMLASRKDSVYLSIGGGAAFQPMRDAGLVSIAAAGQLMLTQILAREGGSGPPRILELVINGPVNTRESRQAAKPQWISDAQIGRVVTELVFDGTTTWPAATTNGPIIVMNERAPTPEDR